MADKKKKQHKGEAKGIELQRLAAPRRAARKKRAEEIRATRAAKRKGK